MIRKARQKIKAGILAKEDRLAKEDDLYKWSSKSQWKASPNLHELKEWSKKQTANSQDFFSAAPTEIKCSGSVIKTSIEFESPIKSIYPENNLVKGHYFRSPRSKSAVILISHWNANAKTYNRLAKIYQVSGISALRLSLPYHDERKPKQMPIASGLLSADLSQTIEGIRQATLETRIAVDWLAQQGYTNIGVIGASLGSLVAFLTACHDVRVKSLVGYLTAIDVADLIWYSTATQHLRESFEPDLTLDDLRQAWSCISASNYIDLLARPQFAAHIGWAKYDTVCPPELTQKMLNRFHTLGIPVTEAVYRCGHNTLATTPFMQLSGYRGLSFMRKQLLA